MSTFKVRVEDLCGAVSDDTALSDWLTEGARYVADRMRPERLILYATDKTDSDGTTGVAITGGRPLSAHKSGYEARLIPIGQKAKALDGDSLHYALATDPAWYMDSSTGYVIPGGGTIKWFGYPTVAYGDSTITNYPSEAYGAVVLYAAIQGQIRTITDLVKTTMAAISAVTFGGGTDLTSMGTALTNQDIELAQGYGGKVSLYLQQYATDIQYAQTQAQRYVQMYSAYFENLKALQMEFNRLVETL